MLSRMSARAYNEDLKFISDFLATSEHEGDQPKADATGLDHSKCFQVQWRAMPPLVLEDNA